MYVVSSIRYQMVFWRPGRWSFTSKMLLLRFLNCSRGISQLFKIHNYYVWASVAFFKKGSNSNDNKSVNISFLNKSSFFVQWNMKKYERLFDRKRSDEWSMACRDVNWQFLIVAWLEEIFFGRRNRKAQIREALKTWEETRFEPHTRVVSLSSFVMLLFISLLKWHSFH